MSTPRAAVWPEVEEGLLREAWKSERKSHWPHSFEESMADPVYSRLVWLRALHPPRRGVPIPQPEDTAPDTRTPIVEPHHPRPFHTPKYPAFDRKRAAAGDRDDD